MKYSEITVKTNSANAELVAYFLQEVCMDGVSIYDKNDLYNNASWDYKDDTADKLYQDEVLVKGYCELQQTNSVVATIRSNVSSLTDAGSLDICVTEVEGDAWVETWKQTFKTIETDKIVICPEWQSVTTNKKVLLLDTGIAFGTGQHETTSMCLELLEDLDLSEKNVLDVGCGSGILGISALLLGAKNAELIDIDPQATDVAKHNVEINNVQSCCVVKTGNLTEQTSGTFDVVFANLTADILALLFDQISLVVHQGTTVILSGILDVKLSQVTEMYGKLFTVKQITQKGEWRALLLQK